MTCKFILSGHTDKWSNSSISYNSIQNKSTKLNGCKYCYVSLTIQLDIVKQLNDLTILLLTVHFIISDLFSKFECQTVLLDSTRCYHSGPEYTRRRWQWRDTQHFPKLLQYWSLNIRLFDVISRTFVVESDLVGLFYSGQKLVKFHLHKSHYSGFIPERFLWT